MSDQPQKAMGCYAHMVSVTNTSLLAALEAAQDFIKSVGEEKVLAVVPQRNPADGDAYWVVLIFLFKPELVDGRPYSWGIYG